MPNKPKISVIVPVYNAEKYIDRCMQSIYKQTFTDYEIILVNDGSKDNSADICRGYAEKDNRITFIDKENAGAGSARNAGITAASGEYLAFPDVDDWFEPDMYDALYSIAAKGNFDIVFSGVNYYSHNNSDLVYSHTSLPPNVCYISQDDCRKNVMDFFPTSTIFDVPWNKLYKRSVAIDNNVRFSDTKRCQDAMFNIDFYNASSRVASIDHAFYNYIENTVSGVQRKFPKNYIDINVQYFSKLISILKSWGIYEKEIKLHYDTSFVIAVYGTMSMFENPVWDMSKEQKTKYIKDIMSRSDIKDMLANADIREDTKDWYRIIIDEDYSAFMRNYKQEKFKEKLRQNKLLISIYRNLRGKR